MAVVSGDRERATRIAAQARDAALAGGPGACGLADVLSALGEGRVAHLVLDSQRRWSGWRTPDGRLAPPDDLPPAVAADHLIDEPHLADQMIVAANRAGADITVPDHLEDLAPDGGLAALLRW